MFPLLRFTPTHTDICLDVHFGEMQKWLRHLPVYPTGEHTSGRNAKFNLFLKISLCTNLYNLMYVYINYVINLNTDIFYVLNEYT